MRIVRTMHERPKSVLPSLSLAATFFASSLLGSAVLAQATGTRAAAGSAGIEPPIPLAGTVEQGDVGFRQACLDVTTDAAVLNVAAHPDDEAGRTMVMLRRKYGLRTVTAYTTYGNGGQNAIGREIGDALAIIRVQETLAAAARTGVEVRWLGMDDFGFSKTRLETLKFWGEAPLLESMRGIVADVDPDLVFSNHSLTRGHGHHRATHWAAAKVLHERTTAGSRLVPLFERSSLEKSEATLDPGDWDPSRGSTWAAQAWDGWVQHRTQGPWGNHDPLRTRPDQWRSVPPKENLAPPAENVVTATPAVESNGEGASADEKKPKPPPPTRVDPLQFLGSVFDHAVVQSALTEQGEDAAALELRCKAFGAPRSRQETVTEARSLLGTLRVLDDKLATMSAHTARDARKRLHRRLDALDRVVLCGVGIGVAAWLPQYEVPAGEAAKAFVMLHGDTKGARLPIRDLQVTCDGVVAGPVVTRTPTAGMAALMQGGVLPTRNPVEQPNGEASANPASNPTSQPGSDQAPAEANAVADPSGDGDGVEASEPVQMPAPKVDDSTRDFEIAFPISGPPDTGHEPRFATVLVTFTLEGTRHRIARRLPYRVVPPIELSWERDLVMVPKDQVLERVYSLEVKRHTVTALPNTPVRFGMGFGLRAEAIPGRVELDSATSSARLRVRVNVDGNEVERDRLDLDTRIGEARAPLQIVPVAVTLDPNMHVGLVRGPDDTLENTFKDLGIRYEALDADRLALADLGQFTVVVLDIRVNYHRRDLAAHRDRLLEYCASGGRIVVLYHKPGEWNPRKGRPSLAPFPLKTGRARVTEEDAAVTMLQPDHPIWTKPHAIGAADFEGWVQERGLNFPEKWGSAWTPLVEMADVGEKKPLQGALLVTNYGQGSYVFCSLALYRQLRRAHEGAVRILINLLARP